MSAVGAAQPGIGASDEQFVAAVRGGDNRAFGELYSRYGGRIVSYVLGMVGDHGRAEDITQEVFISALRRMRATERPIVFKPWIYEIAKNACIDEFRRARRTKEVSLDSDEDGESPTRALASGGPTPDTALERRQQLDDLRGAFRGLSDNHHKILVLRELEGLSYTEIGRRMGMNRPVVESTLFRARKRLGQEYEEIASGQRCEQVHAVIEAGGPTAVRALGIRERRRLARHVAHCQPCRRHAWAAGVDESVLKPPSVVEKIAALLPIPAFLRWRRGGANADPASASSSHSLASLQTASQAVTPFAGAGSPVAGLGRVAAAVAAVALAGGGVVAGISSTQASKPPQHRFAPAVASSGGGPGITQAHHGAPAVATGRANAGVVPNSAGASKSSSGTSTASGASGSTAAASSASNSSQGTAASSSSTALSNTTRSGSPGGLQLPSAPSLPKPKLPPPKVTLPSLPPPLNVSGLTQSSGSAVKSTLGAVNNLLGTG
jgi:RNA polymerase sigma factor (sigma-70 family)